MFDNIKITFYFSVCMLPSGAKARISDEAERVQSVSYAHIRLLSVSYIRCYCQMPVEKIGETRVKTDCLKCRCFSAHTN